MNMPLAAHRATALLFVATAALLLVPLFTVAYLPLVDLPGHFGRFHILHDYATNPQFQARYEILWKPIPNVAIDLVATPLLNWFSMETTGRIVVALGMVLFAAGCWLLSHSLWGRITPLAVLALFAQYNYLFFFGFIAFQWSLALYLITFALWLRWRERWTAVRIGALSLLAVAVYLAHLGGFVFLALSIACATIQARRFDWRGALPLIAPIALYLTLNENRGGSAIAWSSLTMKLHHATVILSGYNMAFDAAIGVVLLLAVLLALPGSRLRVQWDAGVLAAALWIAWAVSPRMFGVGELLDARFAVAAGLLTLFVFALDYAGRRARIAFVIAFCALLVRIGFIERTWIGQSRVIESNIAMFDQIPRGARVFPIFLFDTDVDTGFVERPFHHMISWATVRRDAIVPTTFTYRGQHSVVERGTHWFQEYNGFTRPQTFAWEMVERNFDIVWYFGTDPGIERWLDGRYERMAANGKSKLYRVPKMDRPENFR